MKKLFVLALVAVAMSGCAGRKFYFYPVVQVVVINDCPGSRLEVTSVQRDKVMLAHGEQGLMILERGSRRNEGSLVLTARGTDGGGRYLGSASRTFYVGYRAREDYWQVRNLVGGLGCERVPRR